MLWPEHAAWLFYYLIPKLTGGEHPIGIMATLVRVWERMRKPLMMDWIRTQERSYDWSASGKSSESAVWDQQLHVECLNTEVDDDRSQVSATILFDMVKCFERVHLRHVWEWGCYWGVPKRLFG